MHALRLNPVLSEAQNCYAKDRLWKSAVREIIGSIYHGSGFEFSPPYLSSENPVN